MVFGLGGGQNEMEVVVSGDASGLDQAMSSGIGSITSMEKAVGGLGLAMGALAAGGIAKSIGAASDLDAALNESAAIMGDLTTGELADMENAAREVAKTTTFSANEAAESFYFLASAGMDAEQSVSALPQVAAFAQAGMFDMATATDLATDAQSALGMTSEDAAENLRGLTQVTDVLVKANTLANASVEQFSESLTNKAGSALKSTNKDIEEGVSVLAAYADQGIKGRLAGERLNIVLRDLQKSARENAEAFDELGVQVYDAEGNMRPMHEIIRDIEGATEGMSVEARNAALSTLGLSQQAADGITPLLGMSDAIQEYEVQLRDAGGTTSEIAENQLQSFQAQLSILKSNVVDVAIGIGQVFLPPLTKLVSVVSGAITWFGEFNARLNGMPGAVALVGTAVTGLSLAATALSGALGSALIPMLGTFAVTLGGMLAPIAAVGAAVAGLAYAWKTDFAGIRTTVMNVLDVLLPELRATAAILMDILMPAAKESGDTLMDLLDAAERALGPIIALIGTGLVDAIQTAFPKIRSALTKISTAFETMQLGSSNQLNTLSGNLGTFSDDTRGTFSLLSADVQAEWDEHGDVLIAETRRFTGLIMDVWGEFRAAVLALIQPFIANLEAFWAEHGDTITRIVEKFTLLIEKTFGRLFGYVLSGAIDFLSKLSKRIETDLERLRVFWEKWGDEIMAVLDFFHEATLGMFGTFLDALETMLDIALAAIEGDWDTVWTEIRDFFKRTLTGLREFATEWFTRLVSYIGARLDDIWQGFKDWGSNVKTTVFQTLFDVRENASAWFGGFITSIGDWLRSVLGKFNTWKRNTKTVVRTTLGDIRSAASNWVSGFVRPFQDAKRRVLGQFSDLKRRLVGNSILPDMLSDTLGTIDRWKGPFLRPFRDAKIEALEEFETLKAGITGKINDLRGKLKGWRKKRRQQQRRPRTAKEQFRARLRGMGGRGIARWKNEWVKKILYVSDRFKKAFGISHLSTSYNPSKGIMQAPAQKAAMDIFRNQRSRVESWLSKNAISDPAMWEQLWNKFKGTPMATGGLVTGPVNALIGEGREDEAVLPLSALNTIVSDSAAAGARAALRSRDTGSGGDTYNIHIEAHGDVDGRSLARDFKSEVRSSNI